jgi:hypothetical protein
MLQIDNSQEKVRLHVTRALAHDDADRNEADLVGKTIIGAVEKLKAYHLSKAGVLQVVDEEDEDI